MTRVWQQVDDQHYFYKSGRHTIHQRANVCTLQGETMILIRLPGEVYTEKAKKLTERIIDDLDNRQLVKICGRKILIAE